MENMIVDPQIQEAESWIPGVCEPTHIHDMLHDHFGLGFSTAEEAQILGFQLGHAEQGNVLYALALCLLLLTYPEPYRSDWKEIPKFWEAYFVGKTWRGVPYMDCPKGLL